jgi:hypothetical protein
MNFQPSLLEQEILEKASESPCLAEPSRSGNCPLLVPIGCSVGEQRSRKERNCRNEQSWIVLVLAYDVSYYLVKQMKRWQNWNRLAHCFWLPELHGCAFPHKL